ncbi:MAG: MFS transporter [Thermoprotei archaeon]
MSKGGVRLRFLYLPGNAWILALSSAVWTVGGSIVNPYQSIFFEYVGTPLPYIGVLAALSSVITAITYLVGGYIADTWGRRRVIAVFSFVSAANSFIYFFVKSWPELFIPVTLGAISGLYTPAFNATLNDSMKPELRPRGFASFTILTTIPSVFSPYVGGLLMQRLGYVEGLKIGFFVSGLLGLASVSWRALKLKETFTPSKEHVAGLTQFVIGVIRHNITAYHQASANAKKLILYSALSSAATGLSTLYVSIYVIKGLNLSPTYYGLLTGLSALTTILLLLPAADFVERFGLKRAAVLSALSSPLSMLVFVSANGMNDLIAWSVTGGVSGALTSPTIQSLQGNTVPAELRGRLMAMFSVVPLLVSTPAQLASGLLFTYVSKLAPFIVSIPFYAAAVYILTTLRLDEANH